MPIRQTGQLSLADGLAKQPSRLSETLERVQCLIDWQQIDALLSPLRASRYGAPGYAPLLMLKALLLQQWYSLSDPGLEETLIDRLSFRRFVGLALGETSPDHSTISRFRTALVAQGLSEAVFEAVNLQIDAKGLILRQGTIVDATLVEAHVKRPKKPREDKETTSQLQAPSKGERPASKLIASPTDPEASWAKKGHTRYFGYKGHIAVDLGSGIIRRCVLTTASVADTSIGDALIMGDERALYADKGYDTKARRAALKAAGAKDRIAHRPNKHHALSRRQEQRNAGISRRRAAVERIFAIAKRLMGWWRVRYIGLARNAGHFDLMCTAINLKRLAVLSP
jgi:IS5 family transposase